MNGFKRKLSLGLRRCVSMPPDLPVDYGREVYLKFMRDGALLYSPSYAKKNVIIHGAESLIKIARERNAMLACSHVYYTYGAPTELDKIAISNINDHTKTGGQK